MTDRKSPRSNMPSDRHIDPLSIGLDPATLQEDQLFHWLLISLLCSKPIQRSIVKRAYESLVSGGITSLDSLAIADWERLVALLDRAKYVRFDYSIASRLLRVAMSIQNRFGSVSAMVGQAADAEELRSLLMTFKGIGPVTADMFVSGVMPEQEGEMPAEGVNLAPV